MGVATTDSGTVFSQNASGDVLMNGADTTAAPWATPAVESRYAYRRS
jgi:hypothetical protein